VSVQRTVFDSARPPRKVPGPPEERDPARVREDLADGFITEEQARTVYAAALAAAE
jgi:hypothetical protein